MLRASQKNHVITNSLSHSATIIVGHLEQVLRNKKTAPRKLQMDCYRAIQQVLRNVQKVADDSPTCTQNDYSDYSRVTGSIMSCVNTTPSNQRQVINTRVIRYLGLMNSLLVETTFTNETLNTIAELLTVINTLTAPKSPDDPKIDMLC